jgi:uncharacterized protein (TIGR02588 family)
MTAPRKNWLEWLVFGAGLTLLLATIGYLGYQALEYGQQPAALTVTLGEPWAPDGDQPEQIVVPVTVRNDGGETAAEVKVEVSLVHNGKDGLERRELTFAFVPHMSSRAGAVSFEHRPDPDEMRARVLSYLEP